MAGHRDAGSVEPRRIVSPVRAAPPPLAPGGRCRGCGRRLGDAAPRGEGVGRWARWRSSARTACVLAGLLLLGMVREARGVSWYWDGIRYIQILEPRDHTWSSPDGEYWTNYEPDPPDEYKWATFKAHSRDSHSRDGLQDRPDGSALAPSGETREPRAARTVPGWPGLTADTTVSLTDGDTSTLAELSSGTGFGEWTPRSRYDDREGHPYLEYIEEAKDDCYHPYTVECLNGGTCYDLYEDHYCHCAKGYYGKHCELGALILQPEIPPRWRCPVSSLGNGDGCDCDCGGYDPDCADPSQPVLNCKPAEICVNKTTANDTYGMCVITLAAKPRQFRPRYTPGVRLRVSTRICWCHNRARLARRLHSAWRSPRTTSRPFSVPLPPPPTRRHAPPPPHRRRGLTSCADDACRSL